jgi:hypothetical protein
MATSLRRVIDVAKFDSQYLVGSFSAFGHSSVSARATPWLTGLGSRG